MGAESRRTAAKLHVFPSRLRRRAIFAGLGETCRTMSDSIVVKPRKRQT